MTVRLRVRARVGEAPGMSCGNSHAGLCLAGWAHHPQETRASQGWNRSLRLSKMTVSSIACGKHGARHFKRFCQPSAHRTQGEGGYVLFGSDGQAGRLSGELVATIDAEPRFLEKFSGEAQILGTVHTPKPQLFFVPLKKIETFFELFHGAIKGTGQEIDAEGPRVTRVVHLNADAVFATLVAFHAAAVV